jgi:hypothetical protein
MNNNGGDSMNDDENDFINELEHDPELRSRINLYRD